MVMNDPIAAALSSILNHERIGRKTCLVHPSSKLMLDVFRIMNENGFLGSAEPVTERKGGWLRANLLGSLNACGVIKPRFAVRKDGFEKFEKRYLPAKDVGIIIVSTPKGLMTHLEAKEKGYGGRLIAYCY
jgi:small subunit ribosomal protein S8